MVVDKYDYLEANSLEKLIELLNKNVNSCWKPFGTPVVKIYTKGFSYPDTTVATNYQQVMQRDKEISYYTSEKELIKE